MLDQGEVLQGRYRVVSLLGQGGMGAVYRAWDMRLSILVALKEMVAAPDLDSEALQDLQGQFQQEATVLARLNHPHLVGVTDYFREGRNVYLVMKYIEGESLADIIKRTGPIAESHVTVWAGHLLDALAYCHGQGVLHRDIKPQNIIVRSDGDAVLVDFGLVKLWDPNDPRTRTAVRGVGTPQYAPPEQYDLSSGHTEPRSDLYSVGATMYHALAGQAPPSATMRIAAPEEFVPLGSVARGVSPRTVSTIDRAMELARTRRWETAAEMGRALGLDVSGWVGGRALQAKAETPRDGASHGDRSVAGRGGTAVMPAPQVMGPPGQGGYEREVLPYPAGDMASSPARRRRIPIWAVATGVAALLLGGAFVVAALAFTGVVDLGLPASWTPWLSTPDAGGEVVPVTSPTSTDAPPPSPTATLSTEKANSVVEAGEGEVETPSPSPSPTVVTATPEAPTATWTPSATATPSPPTATPSATVTQGPPTATPTPTPTTDPATVPTPEQPTPSVTTGPETGAAGVIVDFEQWGTWRRGDQPHGEFVQTQEQVHSGSHAGKLTYSFPDAPDDYVVFVQPRAIGGQPDTFTAWVYGDGSGQYLNLWISDAQDEVWAVHLGPVGGSGWRQMSGRLAPGLGWPSGHVYGPDNGVVDYPVRFHAIVLDRPADNPLQGTIYIDDIRASGP